MAERNQKFWLDNELKLSTFESEWYKKLSDGESLNPSKDYSMNEELDGQLERTLGNHLALVGPMFDSYTYKSLAKQCLQNLVGAILQD